MSPTTDVLRVLSLGAGVQSTTVALMTTTGDLPPIDVAIFADTGWEPAAVYKHLAKLEAHMAEHGTPVVRVRSGNIRDDHIKPTDERLFIRNPRKHPEYLGRSRTFIPVYLVTPAGPDRFDPTNGMTRRTCTKTYKIEPVEKEIRRRLGLVRNARWPLVHTVDQLFGISWDETQRMSDSTRPAIHHCYPLVDKRITRDDCHAWLADHGWTAPRSACIGCPFHDDDEWRHIRDTAPAEWADAIEFDATFRARQAAGELPMEGAPYLHRQRVPLDQVDLELPVDNQLSLFDQTCDGFCGT